MRGRGFPHPLFIYYHTLRILSTSLQKSLYDFRLGYNRLIINSSTDIFLYELRPYQKFSKNPTPYIYIYISLFIIPQIITFVNRVMSYNNDFFSKNLSFYSKNSLILYHKL